MAFVEKPKDHPAVKVPKIGIVIANLGTPDATDYWSMRRYLNEFLSDKRVIDLPAWKWQPILQGIVLSIRPQKSGANYETIWNKERNESPLLTITRAQRDKLAAIFAQKYADAVVVDFAMRYGNPSVHSVMARMNAQGVDRVIFFPLYPQYGGPTTATANDAAFRSLMKLRWQPSIRTVPAYFAYPDYLASLGQSIREGLAGVEVSKLVLSYHGMPLRYLLNGDPYHCHCQKSTRLLAEHLDLSPDFVETSFQSKFGREKWIEPATVELVARLAKEGHKSIAVAAPAFSADNIETLEEIDGEIRHAFMDAGGKNFHYIPCLNDREDHIAALANIIENEAKGWL